MPLALQIMNGVHVAALSGGLDNSSGSDLVTSIKASVEKGASIILDCTLMTHMDVAGFKHLLGLHRWSQMGNGRLVLAGMAAEAWALIVDNHCENTFESRASVPAAFQALGVAQQAPSSGFGSADGGAENYPAPPEADSEDTFSGNPDFMAPNESDSWGQPTGAAPTPVGSPPNVGSAWQSPANDSWDMPDTGESGTPTNRPDDNRGFSKKLLIIGIASAAIILIFGGMWLVNYLKVPEIKVSDSSFEVIEGVEPPEVTITVLNGVLDADDIELPDGMLFSDAEEADGAMTYYLGGTPKPGAKGGNIRLTASRGDRHAEPIEIAVKIIEKKMGWPFLPPALKVGDEIKGYTKVVEGAKSVSIRWLTESPGGIEIRQSANNPETWMLAGIPGKDGVFQVEFTATSKGGNEEKKTFPLTVQPAPQPVVEHKPDTNDKVTIKADTSVVEIKNTQADTTNNSGSGLGANVGTTIGNAQEKQEPEITGVGESMRAFLLERIDGANSHFDFKDKMMLRNVVGRLKEAKVIAKLTFGNAKTTLAGDQSAVLRRALNEPENSKLLEHPDCQIIVVGYASTTGSAELNVKLSRKRASSVNEIIRDKLGRGADLCGDYGQTDIISPDEAGNRAVEVFAGIMVIKEEEQDLADEFKADFNKRHGGR